MCNSKVRGYKLISEKTRGACGGSGARGKSSIVINSVLIIFIVVLVSFHSVHRNPDVVQHRTRSDHRRRPLRRESKRAQTCPGSLLDAESMLNTSTSTVQPPIEASSSGRVRIGEALQQIWRKTEPPSPISTPRCMPDSNSRPS